MLLRPISGKPTHPGLIELTTPMSYPIRLEVNVQATQNTL